MFKVKVTAKVQNVSECFFRTNLVVVVVFDYAGSQVFVVVVVVVVLRFRVIFFNYFLFKRWQ